MNEIITSTSKLLNLLKIENTQKYLQDSFLSNPNYPSLLSVSDVLTKYQVNSLALKAEKEQIEELPLPCMVQVKLQESTHFYILVGKEKSKLTLYNNKNKLTHLSNEEFLELWTGIALLAEKTQYSKEEGIEKTKQNKRFLNFIIGLLALASVAWSIVAIPLERINIPIISLVTIKSIGLILTSLLIWYEYDRYNPTLQSFCSGGKKINCNSVLNSRYSKILNGRISLSIIGFSYFFGTLIHLVSSGFTESSLFVLSTMSFLSLPFIIASFYYQAFKIKQWCKFCVVVQIVLLLEITVSYFSKFYVFDLNIKSLLGIFTLMMVPVVVWKCLDPIFQKAKQLNPYKRGLDKLKNTPAVFDALLRNSPRLRNSTEGLGITFSGNDAKYSIVKVCNPYCGPCSKAHPVLEKLFEQGKIDLQILFTASVDGNDKSEMPVRHFMAINEKSKDRKQIQKVLDEWYMSVEKNYEDFARKYPMNGELISQTSKLKEMNEWCKKENIHYTPTIFINGHEMPPEYSIQELVDLL